MRAVLRRGSRKRAGLALWALAALACRTTYYDEYRSRHPEWDGEFPRVDAPLEEVVAGLYAPVQSEDIRVEVKEVQLWHAHGDVANPVDFERWRRGEAPLPDEADVIVIASRSCRSERGLKDIDADRVDYYVLPHQRLEAWDHYEFGKVCSVKNLFRAARGPVIPLERAASQRVKTDYGKTAIDLAQLYRRGLAYLEAGRVVEAQAALAAAEPHFRETSADPPKSGVAAEAYAETARLRAQLVRALGLKSQPESGSAPR